MTTSDSTSASHLLVAVDERPQGSVYRVTVSRPERLNIVDSHLLSSLERGLEQIAADPRARAVILCGAGDKAWIGGADIGEMIDLDPESARAFISRLHRVCRALRTLPVPVLARIHGYCLGAGLELAACCDIRIATSESRFGMPEVQVGIPSVIEAALLPRLMGSGHACDLVLTGRLVDAEQASTWGLVETVVASESLDGVVEDRVTAILRAGPRAIRAQKKLCRQWQELPLGEAVDAGIDAFSDAYRDDEPHRFMQRFLQRARE